MEVASFLTGKRGVSLPFSDYCNPIISKDIPISQVLSPIIEYGKKSRWKHLEIRDDDNLLTDTAPSSSFYVHSLKLFGNGDQIFSDFQGSTKRNIRKAVREGVTVRICNSPESVKAFYRLHCLTRKRHGVPPQPFYFFKKIYKHIISENAGFVALAMHREKTVGGSVYFHFGEKAFYKYGASDRNYQHLRANNLIMWESIKWYSENGYKSFCFGRTDLANEGLRRFKSGWRTTERIVRYFKYDLKKDAFVSDTKSMPPSQRFIFNRMPIPISKWMGRLLYRHAG
ncbi:lipid II:glycine glycyltransferase FemX [Desulfonema ishimotonii]|uniref:lipid II:glycine glycyltransferase FemX n=1 Tax=Desulfonema ishimotonii TaxID=45657 RepID=UPI001E400F9F|nr:GNAT family N-acetyltransferase [Desulfonema ishimotonii]